MNRYNPIPCKSLPKSGFTLIEISIVLVIIGLIVGGILTGQDLIDAAAQRAQISQIERYNTAVLAFQSKYGALPGDLSDPMASSFGFQPRGTNDGEGDGDGNLRGNCADTAGSSQGVQTGCGELAVFWEDLSTAGLIDTTILGHDKGANYPNIKDHPSIDITLSSTPSLYQWLPAAKIGTGNFVYVVTDSRQAYFAVSSVTTLKWNISSTVSPGLKVQHAYNIDRKIDDGLPQSGNVTACYLNNTIANGLHIWASGGLAQGAPGTGDCTATTAATIPAATDCYGNNHTAGTMQYSVSSNANLLNCALSFSFQ